MKLTPSVSMALAVVSIWEGKHPDQALLFLYLHPTRAFLDVAVVPGSGLNLVCPGISVSHPSLEYEC